MFKGCAIFCVSFRFFSSGLCSVDSSPISSCACWLESPWSSSNSGRFAYSPPPPALPSCGDLYVALRVTCDGDSRARAVASRGSACYLSDEHTGRPFAKVSVSSGFTSTPSHWRKRTSRATSGTAPSVPTVSRRLTPCCSRVAGASRRSLPQLSAPPTRPSKEAGLFIESAIPLNRTVHGCSSSPPKAT